MGLFTDCITKVLGIFNESGYVKGVAVVLRNADDTHDVQQGDGAGGAKVSLSTASTAALASAINLSTFVGSSALEKSHVASAVPCNLRSAKALNTSVSTVYLMIFDSATLPANGTAPSRIPIPIASGDVNGDVWQGGTTLAAGCVVALSSTLSTLTLVATSCGWFDCEVS